MIDCPNWPQGQKATRENMMAYITRLFLYYSESGGTVGHRAQKAIDSEKEMSLSALAVKVDQLRDALFDAPPIHLEVDGE